MNKNSEPEPKPAVETDDARESVRDVGHTIMFASTGAGKSVSIAELLRTGDKFFWPYKNTISKKQPLTPQMVAEDTHHHARRGTRRARHRHHRQQRPGGDGLNALALR